MSLKECLRLQDFPDSFNFGEQTTHECYKQLGNSVSVPIIEMIMANMIKTYEKTLEK